MGSLVELAADIAAKRMSSREAIIDAIARIESSDATYNSFITVMSDHALAAAATLDSELANGHVRGALHGVPIALKDNIDVAGVPTTAASPAFRDRIPRNNAEVVNALQRAGAIVIGKTNLFEIAFGGAHNPLFGPPPHNPWGLDRTAGGSSSGSAVALAAGFVPGALGTDTGGSIRAPAGFCGVVGLKPTYDLVSRSGVLPVSYSLDHVGPMARSVEDAAELLRAISTRPLLPARFAPRLSGRTIGVPGPEILADCSPAVLSAFETAVQQFSELGSSIKRVHLPNLHTASRVMQVIMFVEAADYHRELLYDRADLLGPFPRARLHQALFTPAVDYIRAQRIRSRLIVELRDAIVDTDALILPTLPQTAFSESDLYEVEKRQRAWEALTRFNCLFDLTGQPAVTVPAGFDDQGLPFALQLVSHFGQDVSLLETAHAYEQASGWFARQPPAV